MKFGRNLPRNQVPEWDTSYIQYKALKKLIKSAAKDGHDGEGVDIAEFFFSLDRNLEDVENFYNRKFSDATRRLKLLQERYGQYKAAGTSMEMEEAEDLMGALLDLRGLLRKLQWYGEVNRRGFVKITKKLDKKTGQTATQKRYLDSKVDTKQFATNAELIETTKGVNEWLSIMKDVKIRDDGSSTHSSYSINRAHGRSLLNIPLALLESLERAIREDDAATLVASLFQAQSHQGLDTDPLPALSLNLLQRAISARARHCIKELLKRVDDLDDDEDINGRNCLHRFVISIGRANSLSMSGLSDVGAELDGAAGMVVNGAKYLKPAAAPTMAAPLFPEKERDTTIALPKNEQYWSLLSFILENLSTLQRQALLARDVYKRTPLHYAAQFGRVLVSTTMLEHMKLSTSLGPEDKHNALFWGDIDGYTPLHLSVMGGHPVTTKLLLGAMRSASSSSSTSSHMKFARFGDALASAVKANFVDIVRLLVEAGIDVDGKDGQGETALHIAARFGHLECAQVLLGVTGGRKADTEKAENTYGWTPLHVACVDGRLDIVRYLITAGAKLDEPDTSGWTAREHAALRGHVDIAQAIADVMPLPISADLQIPAKDNRHSKPTRESLAEKGSNTQTNGIHMTQKVTEPIKSFGHRYLINESMVLVSLGTMDMRKAVEAVNLDQIPIIDAHATQLDTALSLVVSATGAQGDSSIIDLPVQDSICTEPIVFKTKNATKVKLLFDIVPTYAGSADQIVGRGVALLSTVRPSIGSKRISLQGDVTVPILAVQTMDVIGSVNFNFLIITPFSHPNMAITEDLTYWKSMTSTMVIGHRGLGKNSAARGSLQLGENTIQSFIAAANLGASYVEFDVQLTKDHVPVIYHDFLVSETGIDAPVHTLTLEQFLHINDGRTPLSSHPPSPVSQDIPVKQSMARPCQTRKTRSLSLSSATNPNFEMAERMKHTRDFKANGFKANSRGNSIQAPFTTLEEMLKTLPPHIGFNIEMKYPMLHESEEQEMDTYAVELNSFVDTVLTKVYDLGGKRNVIFSSFNPDICLLLSFKQPSIPVLFLTDAGTSPVGDVRASSLQEAIRFASRWNLLGVVSAAEPLILAPRLVKVVKEMGLVCVSYGVLNNDPEKVKLQVKEGIDAVIVDSVLAIRKGLTGSDTLPEDGTK